jgi:hypothetical protein
MQIGITARHTGKACVFAVHLCLRSLESTSCRRWRGLARQCLRSVRLPTPRRQPRTGARARRRGATQVGVWARRRHARGFDRTRPLTLEARASSGSRRNPARSHAGDQRRVRCTTETPTARRRARSSARSGAVGSAAGPAAATRCSGLDRAGVPRPITEAPQHLRQRADLLLGHRFGVLAHPAIATLALDVRATGVARIDE